MSDTAYRQQPVRVAAAASWIKAAVHCGIRIQPIFQQLGLAERLLRDPMPLMEAALLAQLMQRCAEQAEPPHYFPLVAGEFFAFEHLPALETFLTTCPTVRHALAALPWVNTVLSFVSLQRVDEGPTTSALLIHCDIAGEHADAASRFVEMTCAAIVRFSRSLPCSAGDALYLQLRHCPDPVHQQRLESCFGVAVRGGQPRNALVFRNEVLDRPLLGSLPALNQQARVQVERQLPPAMQASVADTVRQWLLKDPARFGATLEVAATRLNMHPRTLQRRLAVEGQVFADLRDRCRQRLAEDVLSQPGRPDLEALSMQLGFTDRHSLTRAFKRWTGLTPLAWWRRQCRTPGLV